MKRNKNILVTLVIASALVLVSSTGAAAQTSQASPLTSREVVTLVYQLPKHPELRDEIVAEIRKRGIGFPLTDGMRSLVASKSGSDALLRRTLEEAERRRVNPTASALPPDAEANALLDRTRAATLGAAAAMPDFIVKQLIKRSRAYGTTSNWIPQDNLTIAVGFRANAGEDYIYLRAQQKDALGIVNFQPSITAMMNWQDRSFQVTPELLYTGVKNFDLRLRLFMLQGASLTDFGEKQNSRKLEIYAKYYF